MIVSVLIMTMHGQENYRVSRVLTNASGTSYIDQVEYYDGLGRLIQTGARGQSSDGGDIITVQEYDGNGRKSASWQNVPFPSGTGYVPLSEFKTASAQYYGDNYGYTLTKYEPSQSEIATSITRPGNIYHTQDRSVTTERVVNNNTTMLRCAKYTIDTSGKLKYNGYYPPGSYQGTKTIDEDGHIVIEFKNASDKPILQRNVLSEGNYADTYYVYDDYDRLRYVLPPMASNSMTTTGGSWTTVDDIVYQYCYYYEYDIVGNITQKKLPGCDKITYYYNSAHRLVLSRDGKQNSTLYDYTIYLYDKYGREVIRGNISLIDGEVSLYTESDIVAEYTGNGSEETYGYTFNVGELPIYIGLIDVVTYYDDYTFLDKSWFGNTSGYRYAEHPEGDNCHPNSTGRMTGQYVRNSGLSAYYYDAHGNVVQSHSQISGLHSEYTHYSYTNQPLNRYMVHKKSNAVITERYRYSYDHADRLQTIHHRLNGDEEVLLTSNSYNRLGLIDTQTTGGISTATYSYDIEGRITEITSPHFSQELHYYTGSSPCYNGNISQIDWDNGAGQTQSYRYSYDTLNRLTSAQYISEKAGVDYSATYSYDHNGNPTSITRTGITEKNGTTPSYGTIDQMSFTYTGNQLKKIDDNGAELSYEGAMDFRDGSVATTEYSWDKNGNMTRDLNRKISKIGYNSLNLPETITYTDGHKVMNTYDCLGRKVSVIYQISVPSVTTPQADGSSVTSNYYRTYMRRSYSGNCIYRNDTLERILTTTGYITPEGEYHHYLKDYQGNNRIVLNESGQTIERTDYYPYGMPFADTEHHQPYKYSGKELETMNGLRHLDYGARWMDYPVGRFTTIDRYCEKYYNLSPYLYCAANPIMFIDPTGCTVQMFSSTTIEDLIMVLMDLQTLTNYQLSFKQESNGNWTLEMNNEKSYGDSDLAIGNGLIKDLIKSDKTAYIAISNNGGFGVEDANSSYAQNGIGSNVYITYSKSADYLVGVVDASGNFSYHERPSYIGFGHELIHAHRSMYGVAKTIQKNISNVYGNVTENISEEEGETIGIGINITPYKYTENKLRKEHGLQQRVLYKGKTRKRHL